MKKLLLALALLCGAAAAQVDIRINTIGPYIDILRNGTWGGSGVGTLNNSFIFTPISPNVGICVYINNLDTVPHGFTLNSFITGDQQVNRYQGNTAAWFATGAVNQFGFVNASQTIAYFFQVSGATGVTLLFSAAAGSGLVTVTAVQTSGGGCAGSPFAAVTPLNVLASTANGSQTGFATTACTVNPAAGAFILNLRPAVTNTRVIKFWKVAISSTAAGQINFDTTSTSGATCTVPDTVNSTLGGNNSAAAGPQTACAIQPAVAAIADQENVGANAPLSIDLTGFIMPPAVIGGMGITTPAGITGKVCATMYWGEQ